jgi:pyrroloquinoline quinone biosynthesis protein B
MSEIPHPSIEESMALFKSLGPEDRSKVHFIHFNHTNPILQQESDEALEIKQNGYNIATFGQIITL